MATIKKTATYLGGKISFELNVPTIAEYNEFKAALRQAEEGESAVSLRASWFDHVCNSISVPKEQVIPDAKAAWFFTCFENFSIDEKN